MKHTYSFLAGVASISLTVFLTRSLPGYMFLAGFCVCSLSVVLLGRAVGAGRLARFFSHFATPNSIRLSSHWSSDEKGQSNSPSTDLPVVRRTAPSPSCVSKRPLGAVEETRCAVLGSVFVPVRNRNHSRQSYGTESRPRCNSSAAQNGNNRGVVNSVDVLSSVQQDVLSALVNLKVPYSQAEEAIRGARGQSFDELFREALTSVNAGAGKSRSAVA